MKLQKKPKSRGNAGLAHLHNVLDQTSRKGTYEYFKAVMENAELKLHAVHAVIFVYGAEQVLDAFKKYLVETDPQILNEFYKAHPEAEEHEKLIFGDKEDALVHGKPDVTINHFLESHEGLVKKYRELQDAPFWAEMGFQKPKQLYGTPEDLEKNIDNVRTYGNIQGKIKGGVT